MKKIRTLISLYILKSSLKSGTGAIFGPPQASSEAKPKAGSICNTDRIAGRVVDIPASSVYQHRGNQGLLAFGFRASRVGSRAPGHRRTEFHSGRVTPKI